ncbi:MAG: tyrosine-type recombinase/integrase [Acidobacteriota bacterium]
MLTDDELRVVLTAPGDVALLCRVTLISLHRISEVLGLRREHLGPSWMEVRRKGGRVHRIAIPEELRVSLLDRCAKSGYIFGEGPEGAPPRQQTASNRVIRTLANLGLSGVTHHTMRHTGVTMMLEDGINPRVIQLLAGWTSLRMLERYGHTRDSEVRRAVTSNAQRLQQAATKTATVERKQYTKSDS